jgi:hypothetical protein
MEIEDCRSLGTKIHGNHKNEHYKLETVELSPELFIDVELP